MDKAKEVMGAVMRRKITYYECFWTEDIRDWITAVSERMTDMEKRIKEARTSVRQMKVLKHWTSHEGKNLTKKKKKVQE